MVLEDVQMALTSSSSHLLCTSEVRQSRFFLVLTWMQLSRWGLTRAEGQNALHGPAGHSALDEA